MFNLTKGGLWRLVLTFHNLESPGTIVSTEEMSRSVCPMFMSLWEEVFIRVVSLGGKTYFKGNQS